MVIKFHYFTLMNLRVLGDTTLSLNMKSISPEMPTWIESKHEQPFLTDVHTIKKSV